MLSLCRSGASSSGPDSSGLRAASIQGHCPWSPYADCTRSARTTRSGTPNHIEAHTRHAGQACGPQAAAQQQRCVGPRTTQKLQQLRAHVGRVHVLWGGGGEASRGVACAAAHRQACHSTTCKHEHVQGPFRQVGAPWVRCRRGSLGSASRPRSSGQPPAQGGTAEHLDADVTRRTSPGKPRLTS